MTISADELRKAESIIYTFFEDTLNFDVYARKILMSIEGGLNIFLYFLNIVLFFRENRDRFVVLFKKFMFNITLLKEIFKNYDNSGGYILDFKTIAREASESF